MELFPQASLSGTVMTSGTVRRILLHGLPSSYFLTDDVINYDYVIRIHSRINAMTSFAAAYKKNASKL